MDTQIACAMRRHVVKKGERTNAAFARPRPLSEQAQQYLWRRVGGAGRTLIHLLAELQRLQHG